MYLVVVDIGRDKRKWMKKECKKGQLSDYSSQHASPAAGNSSDLWEGELEEDLLLLVHKVNPGPVDGNDQVIFRQTGT